MMFDALMSGRYDWILFPLGLVVIAVLVSGVWRDFREPSRDIRRLIACEATAMEKSGAVEARLAACQVQVKTRRGQISNCPVPAVQAGLTVMAHAPRANRAATTTTPSAA
jgi:hypothetical protein